MSTLIVFEIDNDSIEHRTQLVDQYHISKKHSMDLLSPSEKKNLRSRTFRVLDGDSREPVGQITYPNKQLDDRGCDF